MTNTDFKFGLTQDTLNVTKSKQLNFTFPPGKNAYRIDSIRVQITDLDVIATADSFSLQFSYLDLNGLSLETIDSDDEIATFGETYEVLGTNGPITKNIAQVRLHGVKFDIGEFICKEEAYLNFDTEGQDAVETARCVMKGQYVNLDKNAIDRLLKPTTVK